MASNRLEKFTIFSLIAVMTPDAADRVPSRGLDRSTISAHIAQAARALRISDLTVTVISFDLARSRPSRGGIPASWSLLTIAVRLGLVMVHLTN